MHDLRSRVSVVSASPQMLREIARLAYRLRVRGRRADAAHRLAVAAAEDPD